MLTRFYSEGYYPLEARKRKNEEEKGEKRCFHLKPLQSLMGLKQSTINYLNS